MGPAKSFQANGKKFSPDSLSVFWPYHGECGTSLTKDGTHAPAGEAGVLTTRRPGKSCHILDIKLQMRQILQDKNALKIQAYHGALVVQRIFSLLVCLGLMVSASRNWA